MVDHKFRGDAVIDIDALELLIWRIRTDQRSGAIANPDQLALASRRIQLADEQLDSGTLHPMDARILQILRDELEEAVSGPQAEASSSHMKAQARNVATFA